MLSRRKGFTLVELLIASLAMGLVVMYTMGSFTIQHQTAAVIDQVSEVQQNTRAVANMIERDIRNSGYLVPTQAAMCGTDLVNGPDTLYMSDTDAILPVDQLDSTLQGTELGATTTTAPGAGTTTLVVDNLVIDGDPTYKATSASAALDSDFRVDGGVIVVDRSAPNRGAACGRITAITTATRTLTIAFDGTLGAGGGPSSLYVIPAHIYRVDNSATPSRLLRNGVLLAKDVEDLQAAFLFDLDDDGIADPSEYKGDASTNMYAPSGLNGEALVEIRFHIVVATHGDDPRMMQAGRGQARENRDPNTVAAPDRHHRRVYTSTIRIRNNMS